MSPARPSSRNAAHVAYGLLCYGTFLATSAYALGFVGNYWAVFGWHATWLRTIDGGGSASLAEALAIDLGLLALFGVQHSVMARQGFKRWWSRIVPPELERSTYVLASNACLALLFWLWRPIGHVVFDVSDGPLGIALVALSFVGWFVVVRATFLIDHAELFGLRQAGILSARPPGPVELATPGLYQAVRHPLYLGFLVAFWATPVMSVGHLVFAAGLTIYVLVAIPLEERDLIELFGEQYRNYRKRVRALLPLPRSGPRV